MNITGNVMKNYDEAYKIGKAYLEGIAHAEGIKHYEIVGDSYKFPYGLMLVPYADETHETEIEGQLLINLETIMDDGEVE